MYTLAEVLYRDYSGPMPVFRFSGTPQHGLGLLESALGQPSQSYDGEFLYTSLQDMAATLLRSMIKNHPFFDGNKRMALTTTEVFLLFNDHVLTATQEERVKFALAIAADKPDISVEEVAQWIREHSMSFEEIPEDAAVQATGVLKRVSSILHSLNE